MAALWGFLGSSDWQMQPCGIPRDHLLQLGVISEEICCLPDACAQNLSSRHLPDCDDLLAETVPQDTPPDSISRRAGGQDDMRLPFGIFRMPWIGWCAPVESQGTIFQNWA